MKLPVGAVSDEANNAFSRGIELSFMRSSVISILRQFIGPGESGKHSPAKATESPVQVVYQAQYGMRPLLGFVRLSVPHVVGQIHIAPGNECHFIADAPSPTEEQSLQEDFLGKVKRWDGTAQHLINSTLAQTVILAHHKDCWYIAASSEAEVDRAFHFRDLLRRQPVITTTRVQIATRIRQDMCFTMDTNDYFRVCAKIAFNFLCLQYGTDFVLQTCFDPIREWILNGGTNNFVEALPFGNAELRSFLEGDFPLYSHKVLVFVHENELMAAVSFYGAYGPTMVHLVSGQTFDIEDGFICDWQNSKETTLADYRKEQGAESL